MTNDSERALREALGEIARIAKKASRHSGHDDCDHGDQRHPDDDGPVATNFDLGCSLRQLPDRLLDKAASTAIRINPANGLNMAAMASLGLSPDIFPPQRISVLTAKYWGPQARQLTVSFMEPAPADLRRKIVSHLNAWDCAISFVETRGVGDVRISRGGGGYWSYLGIDVLLIPRNQQTMNLQGFTMSTPDSEFRRVIRHEAGHTLGFPHEHMRRELVARIDRQKAYDYFWRTQGWNRQQVDDQVLKSLDDRNLMRTPADEDSLMCYQLPGSITRNGRAILGGTDINATDRAFCARLYPKQAAMAGAAPNGHDHDDEMPIAAASHIGGWDQADDVDPDLSSY